jgi:hypothetical protein
MDTSSVEIHTVLAPVVPVLHKLKLLLEERVIWCRWDSQFL